jgi:hypothetical protein
MIGRVNWHRGFVRLWLAASAIWLVIAGAAFSLPHSLIDVASWNPPVFDPSKPFTREPGPPPSPAQPDTDAGPWTKYQHSDQDQAGRGLPPLPPGFVPVKPSASIKPSASDAAEIPPPPWRAQQGGGSAIPPPPWKQAGLEAHITATANLRSFAIFGVGLPVLTLALGIIGWWIQRGFRPSNLYD